VSVSSRLLEMPIEGVRLPSTTLGGVIQSAPLVWLQFLRHLGCIYCKGLVEDIRAFMGAVAGGASSLSGFCAS